MLLESPDYALDTLRGQLILEQQFLPRSAWKPTALNESNKRVSFLL